ncbi:MAG: SUMF1/EgtB/PvdO family nonheme iron enzyme [Thiolinea sp.]
MILTEKRAITVGFFGEEGLNDFGLSDMSGNVWEWTCSNWSEVFNGEETKCRDKSTEIKVIRGGSWYEDSNYMRSSTRKEANIYEHRANIGFRVINLSN